MKNAPTPRKFWTPAESETALRLKKEGKTQAEIAAALGRSPGTISVFFAPKKKYHDDGGLQTGGKTWAEINADFLAALKDAKCDEIKSEYVIKRGVARRIAPSQDRSYVGSTAALCAQEAGYQP